jgi:hypothetical protein
MLVELKYFKKPVDDDRRGSSKRRKNKVFTGFKRYAEN